MQKVKIFRCPGCSKTFNSLKVWGNHVLSQHKELIPEGWTPARYFYFLQTGKKCGCCIECKQPTDWNESTCKYNRFCNDPKCKEKYRESFKARMIGKYGKVTLLDDPDQQRKMIMGRKNSGYYDFPDGKIGYSSSYEYDFLKMCDTFLHMSSQDIMQPSPHTYYYEYQNPEDKENEGKKFYIPDFFIPSLNLEIEIKQNTSTHPKILRIDKVKEREKDAMMNTIHGINYIKIVDKDYTEFFATVTRLRSSIPNTQKPALESRSNTPREPGEFTKLYNMSKDPEKLLAWMLQHIKYANFTKLMSPIETFRRRSGSCHDQMYFAYNFLSRNVRNPKQWFFMEHNKSSGGVTHSFITYEANGKIIWFESAWGGHQGLHEFNSIDEIEKYIRNEHKAGSWGEVNAFPNVIFKRLKPVQSGMSLQNIVDSAVDKNYMIDGKRTRETLEGFRVEILDKLHNPKLSCLKHVRFNDNTFGEIFYDKDKPVCYYMMQKSLDPMDTAPWIIALEVLPEYRGLALSTQLLTRITSQYGTVNLSVNKKNSLAYSIYLKFGFIIFKESPDMYFMRFRP